MKPLSFTIERATIKTQSVRMKELADGFGYIRISQFQERTAEDLAANINKLEKSGHLKGLILDLRNDPGGLLQAAIGVSAAFLPEKSDVVSIKGRTPQSDYAFKAVEKDYRSGNAAKALAELTPAAKTVPLVVLINSSSASASEIVAGALQDHKRAVLLGDRSFGKGSVQTILPMTFGEKTVGVKLTTARYYTRRGVRFKPAVLNPTSMWTTRPKATSRPFRFVRQIWLTTLPISRTPKSPTRIKKLRPKRSLMTTTMKPRRQIGFTFSVMTKTGSLSKPLLI